MIHNNKEVLNYWNKPEVESMYDKYLITEEIQLINSGSMKERKYLMQVVVKAKVHLNMQKIIMLSFMPLIFQKLDLKKQEPGFQIFPMSN